MKKLLRCAVAGTVFSVFLLGNGRAFSREGHETIAELGYDHGNLSAPAKAAIDRLLTGETIADAAEWPDAIKPPFGAISHTQPAKDFVAAHPNHHLWHFVNAPVGNRAYQFTASYSIPTDIVHAVTGCIAVLEGTGSFDGLTPVEALRYLVHLVGDAHQPLHTINGYFDIHDPAHAALLTAGQPIPAGAFADGGGNALVFGSKELHGDWDDDLVQAVASTKDTTSLVSALLPKFSPTAYATPGDYHHWIEAWVSDSMPLAADAYVPISFGAYSVVTDSSGKKHKQIQITLPSNYQQVESKVVADQLLKGGAHLAQLLNAIKWSN